MKMAKISALCAGSVAAVAIAASSAPAYAQPVEYVRVCTVYGASFNYIPGTDTCRNPETGDQRKQTAFGTIRNMADGASTVQGRYAFAGGVGSVAVGGEAWAGADPTSDAPPYDPTSGLTEADWNRRFPRTAFSNQGATAVGSGARAGAGALGQTNATALGQAAIANAANATALGQGATANFTSSVAIGQGSATTAASTVSFGTVGSERRLMNVAAGVMGTDAVNVAQLNAAVTGLQTQVTSLQGQYAALEGRVDGLNAGGAGGGSATGSGAMASGQGAVASGNDTTAIGRGARATYEGGTAIGAGAVASADPTTAVGFGAQATANNGSAFGGLAIASGENSTALGESSIASAAQSTAVGRGAVASVANSVALGAGSTAVRGAQSGYTALGLDDDQDSAGEVSVGSATGARQITNLAAGSADTDAVNVSQLRGVLTQSQDYTDARILAVGAQMEDMAREADAGTAAAMAIAALPSAMTPGRSMVAAGMGVWRDESALAVGLSHRFDRHWSLRAGGTVTESGDAGFNAGVGFEF